MSTHSLESRRSRWEARSGQTVRPLRGHHRSRADVDPASPEAGIQPGDLILEVNRRPVRSPAEIQAALQKVRLAAGLVAREGKTLFLAVQARSQSRSRIVGQIVRDKLPAGETHAVRKLTSPLRVCDLWIFDDRVRRSGARYGCKYCAGVQMAPWEGTAQLIQKTERRHTEIQRSSNNEPSVHRQPGQP